MGAQTQCSKLTRRRNADEWEATEQAYNALQAELKSYGLWEDKILFVDDDYETGTIDTSPKLGWGEAITSNLSWAASKLFGRKPEEPGLPTSVQAPAPGVHSTLGPAPHPKPAAEFNKSSDSSQPQAVPSGPGEQKEFRGLASHSWTQASIAAQGIGAAAMAVGNRDAVDGLGSPTKSAQNPYAAPNTYSSSNPYGSPTKAMLYESSPKRQSPAPATVQPQGETESSGEKKSAGTENKVSEVSEKIAAVKIDSDSQDVQDVEVKDEVKEVKPVKPVEEENAEAAFEAKKEEIKEAVAEAKAIEEEKKAVTEDKDITAAKKDEFDDVDLLDDAPATPATAETTETETDDKEEEDTADIADAPATATATETKAAPKKKNKKKGKKGKN